MIAIFMHVVALVALVAGIVVAAGAGNAPALFVGLTLVICAVMVFCTCAIVGALSALRSRAAAQLTVQPLYPPPPPAHHPLS